MSNFEIVDICVDIDCSIIMIKRQFVREHLFDVSIQKMTSFVSIRDIKRKIVKIDEFVIVKLYFDDTLIDQIVTRTIEIKIYFIDDFAINLLLDNDVLYSQNIIMNLQKQKLFIDNCQKLKLFLKIQTRQNSHVKRTIKTRETFTITLEQFVEMFVNYRDDLFNNKFFLFESQCKQNFDFEKNVYVYVVDVNLSKTLIRNTIN